MATAPDGRTVVVWWSVGSSLPGESLIGILGQRLDPNGVPAGAEFRLDEAAACPELCRRTEPDVAVGSGGEFVAGWQVNADYYSLSIRGRRFGDNGAPLGPEFDIAQGDLFVRHGAPSIAMLEGGGFVASWNRFASWSSADTFEIQARRFDASGVPVGETLEVNSLVAGAQVRPTVAATPSGGFVVVWQSEASAGDDGSGMSIQMRRFDESGVPAGPESQVNTYTLGNQLRPDIGIDADGDFVIVWESWGSLGGDESQGSIQARRFSSDGTPAGPEIQVNQRTDGEQGFPAVAVETDGDFLVSWWDEGVIRARRFDSLGTPVGDELQINSGGVAARMSPAVDGTSDGDFVVAWASDTGTDGDALDAIEARRVTSTWLFVDGFETGDVSRWSIAAP